MGYTFTETDLGNVNHAVNLLREGTAPELPYPTGVHESIVQDLSAVSAASGFMTRGQFYQSIRDNPISTLLNFAQFIGVKDSIFLAEASALMTQGQSVELPLDDRIIQSIIRAAGSFDTPGAFKESLRDKPISTLAAFLRYAGTGATYVNGDPLLLPHHDDPNFNLGGPASYYLAAGPATTLCSGAPNPSGGVKLTWTVPSTLVQSISGIHLYVQKSTVANDMPHGSNTVLTYAHGVNNLLPADPNWTTIHDFGATLLGQYPVCYVDSSTPSASANYRLVFIFNTEAGTADGAFGELDWNVVSVVKSGGLTSWAKSFGSSANDSAEALITDASGNCFLTGYFSGTTDFTTTGTGVYGVSTLSARSTHDMYLAKYDDSGVLKWVKQFGAVGGNQVLPTSIALDSSGNIIVGGGFYGTGNFGGANFVSHGDVDAFLAKYSSLGAPVWSFGFGANFPEKITSLAVGSDDSIVASGFFQGNVTLNAVSGSATLFSYGTGIDPLLFKVTSDGALVFAKNFFNGGTEFGQQVLVDTANSNRIFLLGRYDGYINFKDSTISGPFFLNSTGSYIARFAADGTPQFAKSYGNPSTRFWTAAFDSSKNVVVAGDFSGTTNLGGGSVTAASWGLDLFIARFSGEDGNWQVQSIIPGFQATVGRPLSIAVDSAGSVIVAGYFTGLYSIGGNSVTSSGGITRGFLGKLNANYQGVWAVAGADTDNQSVSQFQVASSPGASVIVGGYFAGTLKINGATLVSAGGIDSVFLKIT